MGADVSFHFKALLLLAKWPSSYQMIFYSINANACVVPPYHEIPPEVKPTWRLSMIWDTNNWLKFYYPTHGVKNQEMYTSIFAICNIWVEWCIKVSKSQLWKFLDLSYIKNSQHWGDYLTSFSVLDQVVSKLWKYYMTYEQVAQNYSKEDTYFSRNSTDIFTHSSTTLGAYAFTWASCVSYHRKRDRMFNGLFMMQTN